MLKFKTSCAVLAYLSSNLLNEVGLSLFRYFEVGLRVCDIVVKKFTFAISSPDELLLHIGLVNIGVMRVSVSMLKSCHSKPNFWSRYDVKPHVGYGAVMRPGSCVDFGSI